MNFCNNVGVIWMAEDDFSAKILRQLADFAGLTEQNSPAVAVLNSMETPEYLAAAESGKFNAGFCCLFRILPDGSIDIFIERNDFSGSPELNYGRLRQIFYLGLMTGFNNNELPIHGALASFNGKGWLFLGCSGMGKSTTMRRLSAEWRVLSDDAVYLKHLDDGKILCYPLPTWSCGYAGTANIFTADNAVPLAGIIELKRGCNSMTLLSGLERYRELLRGFHDLFSCFECGFNAELKRNFRCQAVNFAGMILEKNLLFYRMKINLKNDFADLLRNCVC